MIDDLALDELRAYYGSFRTLGYKHPTVVADALDELDALRRRHKVEMEVGLCISDPVPQARVLKLIRHHEDGLGIEVVGCLRELLALRPEVRRLTKLVADYYEGHEAR